MAITDFILQESRGEYPSLLDWEVLRQQKYGWLDLAKGSELPNMVNKNMVENSWGRPAVKIPVMTKNLPTLIDGPMGCDFVDLDANGQYVAVTFVEKSTGFDMIPAEVEQSELTYEQLFARKMKDTEEALANYLELAIHNAVDTAKATTYGSTFVGVGKRYPLAGDALQVTDALSQRFFNDARSIMLADDYQDRNLNVIGDAQLPSYVTFNSAQGTSNNTNLGFQFNDYNFLASRTTVTSGGTTNSTGFIVPDNSIAYISRIDGDSKAGRKAGDGIEWSSFFSQFLGIDLMVKYKSACGDVSARTLNPSDIGRYKEQWRFGFNLAIFTPFVDAQTNTGIKKFDFLAA
tara:strand:- start:5 stop:1045 length:1041 start_codon:yes stop_codon:yes gene_type:complete